MKLIHLLIVGLFFGLICQETQAQRPGKIPASFLGTWESVEDQQQSRSVRYQKTGMIERYTDDLGNPAITKYYKSGKFAGSYRTTLDIPGVGAVPAKFSLSGKWTYKSGLLKTNAKLTVRLPSLNRAVTGRVWAGERVVNNQLFTNLKMTIGGEVIRVSGIDVRVPEPPLVLP